MSKVSRRYFRPKKEPNSCQHCGKETNDLYFNEINTMLCFTSINI